MALVLHEVTGTKPITISMYYGFSEGDFWRLYLHNNDF